MPSTILITGANGQVGQELQSTPGPYTRIALTRAQLDITDSNQVVSAIREYQPDILINAAAYTQVDQAETDSGQAFAINRDGVGNLAKGCLQYDIPLLHISTDYVFSGDDPGEYYEGDPVNPLGVYGESKLAGEQLLRERLEKHLVLRTSWVFSAHGSNFVKTMLRLGRERDELGIVDDQQGCPTSAGSIAQTLLTIADLYLQKGSVNWGTYHYCNSPATTWYQFADSIFRSADGYKNLCLKRITTADFPTPASRPKNSVLNCDKLQSTFGIAPTDWHDELARVLEALEA